MVLSGQCASLAELARQVSSLMATTERRGQQQHPTESAFGERPVVTFVGRRFYNTKQATTSAASLLMLLI